jgi:hypothetical protein
VSHVARRLLVRADKRPEDPLLVVRRRRPARPGQAARMPERLRRRREELAFLGDGDRLALPGGGCDGRLVGQAAHGVRRSLCCRQHLLLSHDG